MRKNHCATLAATLVLTGQALAATTELPASLAGAPGTASNRGFIVRTVQAPTDAAVDNNFVRANRQLHGMLVYPAGDPLAGTPIPDEASPGPEAGGVFFADTINFERDAIPYDVNDVDGGFLWTFYAVGFPGIPGAGGHTDKFAVEAVGFLDLPLGSTTFGISVGTDRTDVNDDDGYEVRVGANPRDYLALRVAQFQRQAPGFTANTHGENQFTVVTTQAGLYPFRITYWQTTRGANLTFYTINNETGERIVVNEPADDRAIKAYRTSTWPAANAP